MNFGREYGLHFADQSRLGRQYERFHSWHYSDDYDTVMAIYYQQIYAIDVALGMIRDALRDAGVQGETVVVTRQKRVPLWLSWIWIKSFAV